MAVADLLRRDEADALVREAHLNVYRHPEGFPGFRARLRVSTDDAVVVGRVTVPAQGPLAIDLPADDATLAWVRDELALMTEHRRHRAYADSDGRWDKDVHDAADAPLGRVVHIADPLHSSYRIEQGHITRIGRSLPVGRLSVLIQDQAAMPDGRWAASHFAVVLQDEATGAITSVATYRDTFTEAGGVAYPARRRIASVSAAGTAAREILLEHHEVLA